MFRVIYKQKRLDFNISNDEYTVMDLIEKLSIKQPTCTMSMNNMAEELGLSRSACQRIVNKLLNAGLLLGAKATNKKAAALTVCERWKNWVAGIEPTILQVEASMKPESGQGGRNRARVAGIGPNIKNVIKELIKDNTMDIFFEDFFSFFFKKEGISGGASMEDFLKHLFKGLKSMEEFKDKFPGAPVQLEELAAAYFEKAPNAQELELMKQTPDPKENMWTELQEMKRRTRALEAHFMNMYPSSAGDIRIEASMEDINAASLFPEYPNAPQLAPLSPPKGESATLLPSLKGKRTVASLAHNDCMAMYIKWYEHRIDVKPKIDVADGTALKHILKYIQESVQSKRQKKGDITPVEPDDVRKGLSFILNNWDERLADDKWLRSQITLKSMNCNLNKIVAQFNAKKAEPVKYASDGSIRESSDQRLARKLAEYYAANPQQ